MVIRMPRAVTAVFALMLAPMLLSGCGRLGVPNGSPASGPASKTGTGSIQVSSSKAPGQRTDFWNAPVITVMKPDVQSSYRATSGFDDNDNPYAHYIFNNTGIRIEMQYQPVDGYPEKVQLVLASGDVPDLVNLTGDDSYAINTARGGALQPINEYIDRFPNLKRVYNEQYWQENCFDSNKYFLKSQYVLPVANKCTLIRQDWLDQLKLGMPATVSELYDTARAFVAAKPDGQKNTFGLIARKPLDNFWALSAAYGNPRVDCARPYIYIDKAGKKLSLWNTSEAARAYYREIEKWWNEGLIDKESLTATSDQFNNKINNGSVGIICHNAESAGWRTTWIRQVQKRKVPTLAVVPPLKGSGFNNQYGITGGYEQTEAFEGYMGFPRSSSNIENVLKVFDFECSPEFIDYAIFGLKGLEYDVKDGKKVINYDYRQSKSFSDDYLFTFDKADMTPEQQESMLVKFAVGDPDYDPQPECLERLKKAFQTTETMAVPLQSWIPLVPKLPVEDMYPDVDTTMQDLSIKLVTGELDANNDADWNAYLKAVNDSGLLSIIKKKEDYLLRNDPQFFQSNS